METTTITFEGLSENITATATTDLRCTRFSGSKRQRCTLMELVIDQNRDKILRIPCFSCTFLPSQLEYYNHFGRSLTDFIKNTALINCANNIARELLRRILLPANLFFNHFKTHHVSLAVQDYSLMDRFVVVDDEDEEDLNRVVDESFEEVGPERKPCKIESVIEMVMARSKLEALDWKESKSHDCVICMEEIESMWGSFKMPCSHVFHDKCLLRWLDDNHVCPLCRFELPLESPFDDA